MTFESQSYFLESSGSQLEVQMATANIRTSHIKNLLVRDILSQYLMLACSKFPLSLKENSSLEFTFDHALVSHTSSFVKRFICCLF